MLKWLINIRKDAPFHSQRNANLNKIPFPALLAEKKMKTLRTLGLSWKGCGGHAHPFIFCGGNEIGAAFYEARWHSYPCLTVLQIPQKALCGSMKVYMKACPMQTFCCSKKKLELIRGSTSRGEQQNNFTHWNFRHPLPLVPADRGSQMVACLRRARSEPLGELVQNAGPHPQSVLF